MHCLCMRAHALDCLCRGTFRVLKIIWPMKTLILNVLLKVAQNILTFRKTYDNAFQQGKNTLNAGSSQNLLQVFWDLLLCKSPVLFNTILSWSFTKPVGAKAVLIPSRLYEEHSCTPDLSHFRYSKLSLKGCFSHHFIHLSRVLKRINSSRHGMCW